MSKQSVVERRKADLSPFLIKTSIEQTIRRQLGSLNVQLLYGTGDRRQDLAHTTQPNRH